MNKITTIKTYFADNQLNKASQNEEFMEVINKKTQANSQPSNQVINFLLNYSKSLEVQKGLRYQLN